MNAMRRREMLKVTAAVVLGMLALRILGYAGWDPWPQLIGGAAVLLLASLAAPATFGWREDPPLPRD